MRSIVTILLMSILLSTGCKEDSTEKNYLKLPCEAHIYDVENDDAGNTYLSGIVSGDIHNSEECLKHKSERSHNGFIAKLDSNKNFEWVKQIGSWKNLHPFSLKVDKDSIYLVGSGGDTHYTEDYSFFIKFDKSGEIVWEKRIPFSTGIHSITDLDVDSKGNLFLVGFENLGSSRVKTNTLHKFNSKGEFLWKKNWGKQREIYLLDTYFIPYAILNSRIKIKIDSKGSIWIASNRCYYFGDNKLSTISDITKFDERGNKIFEKEIERDNILHRVVSIDTDNNNNLYITGYKSEMFEGFVSKYDTHGKRMWEKDIKSLLSELNMEFEYRDGTISFFNDVHYSVEKKSLFVTGVCSEFLEDKISFVLSFSDEGNLSSYKEMKISSLNEYHTFSFENSNDVYLFGSDSNIYYTKIDLNEQTME